jgi:transposase
MTTKLHLACDGSGRPLSVVVTPGQRRERTQLEAVLDAIRVKRPGEVGRPSTRPTRLIANSGYRYPSCRLLL